MPRRKSPRAKRSKAAPKREASPERGDEGPKITKADLQEANAPTAASNARVQKHYAVLFLAKDERMLLLKFARACVDQCGDLPKAWKLLCTEKTGVVSLTQFSIGLGNIGVQKYCLRVGVEPIDSVAVFNALNMDGSSSAPTLSEREFLQVQLILHDEAVRDKMRDVEKIADLQQLVPTERVLVELWLHILPHRTINPARREPMEHDHMICQQLLKTLVFASMSQPLIKAEVSQLAAGGVLVLREVLMTYSRSMLILQEIVAVVSAWADIPATRPALLRGLHQPFAYISNHPTDGIDDWEWEHLHVLHLALLKLHGDLDPKRRGKKDADDDKHKRATRAELARQSEKTPLEILRDIHGISELGDNFGAAESQYEAQQAVDSLVWKLKLHFKVMMDAVTLGQGTVTSSNQKIRTAFVEYESPFTQDFVFATENEKEDKQNAQKNWKLLRSSFTEETDSKFGDVVSRAMASAHKSLPGAYIKEVNAEGLAEDAGVAGGWRLTAIRRGKGTDPIEIKDTVTGQKFLERWGMSKVPLVLTFEGPEDGKARASERTGTSASSLSPSGVNILMNAVKVHMSYGKVRVMNKLVKTIVQSGHWRAGCDNYEDVLEVSQCIEEYYVVLTERIQPRRADFVSMESGGVPQDLHNINALAQMYLMLKAGPKGKTMEDVKKENEKKSGPEWRPLSAGTYHRIRRPLSGTSPYRDKFSRVPSPGHSRPASPEPQRHDDRPLTARSEPATRTISPRKGAPLGIGNLAVHIAKSAATGSKITEQKLVTAFNEAPKSPVFAKTAWAKRAQGVESLRHKLATTVFVSPQVPLERRGSVRGQGRGVAVASLLSRTW